MELVQRDELTVTDREHGPELDIAASNCGAVQIAAY
jgi:hypothetical protein